ncbi:hypothetical protein D1007_47381 [Hordeum vulgare]|nr:hypothetical protein D1007_47381 [Hordeum vulgare]
MEGTQRNLCYPSEGTGQGKTPGEGKANVIVDDTGDATPENKKDKEAEKSPPLHGEKDVANSTPMVVTLPLQSSECSGAVGTAPRDPMRIGAYNYRGLGNGPAIDGLLEFQRKVDPDILFLSETKLDSKRIDWLRWKLDLTGMRVKDCQGQSGGLALFWRSNIYLKVGKVPKYHIDAKITESNGFKWRFTASTGNQNWKKGKQLGSY